MSAILSLAIFSVVAYSLEVRSGRPTSARGQVGSHTARRETLRYSETCRAVHVNRVSLSHSTLPEPLGRER